MFDGINSSPDIEICLAGNTDRRFLVFSFEFLVQIARRRQVQLKIKNLELKTFAMPPPKKSSARARTQVLAQWRGVDYAPLETARATPARLPGDVLPALLKELRLDARQAEAEVVKVWNSLIDPVVTAHAQPANLHKGTLFVNVDSSVWLSEIVRYRRKEILDRLQHSFGKSVVQKISFRIG